MFDSGDGASTLPPVVHCPRCSGESDLGSDKIDERKRKLLGPSASKDMSHPVGGYRCSDCGPEFLLMPMDD